MVRLIVGGKRSSEGGRAGRGRAIVMVILIDWVRGGASGSVGADDIGRSSHGVFIGGVYTLVLRGCLYLCLCLLCGVAVGIC